ncbi:hypothetical protein [Brevundimonas sp.]|uniref:hypothetical protein n=1 Tax=Brevundimonas sp. TaxID=1871086 RepID=UPI00273787C5|nr:hypothetical protein [Brevundimonas sp.]MDP3801949.1 hypothetical protein [Brevundimonas sp.]
MNPTACGTGGEGRSDPLAIDPEVIQFTVIRGDGDWRVLRDGRNSGQFDFSVDAIESALVRATTLIDKGARVEVFVQDAAGQLRQVDPVGGEVLH